MRKISSVVMQTLFLLLVFSVTARAGADSLPVPGTDFFRLEESQNIYPLMRTAREWSMVPDLSRAARGRRKITVPRRENGFRYMTEFEFFGTTKLTDNELSAGNVCIKADGEQQSMSMLLAPRVMFRFGYMHFDVKTSGAGIISQTESFRSRNYEIRYRGVLSRSHILQGMGVVSFMDNNVDNMVYMAGVVGRPLSPSWTASIGVEHSDSQDMGEETGVVAGLRKNITPSLSAYAMYRGADPVKFLYNNQFLGLVSLPGGAVCVDCDEQNTIAGLSYKPNENLSINIYGYDLADLSFPAGSLLYVIR